MQDLFLWGQTDLENGEQKFQNYTGEPGEWPAENWDQSNKGYQQSHTMPIGNKYCSARHVQARLKFAWPCGWSRGGLGKCHVILEKTHLVMFGGRRMLSCIPNTIPTVKHRGRKIMLWGCFSPKGLQDDWSMLRKEWMGLCIVRVWGKISIHQWEH